MAIRIVERFKDNLWYPIVVKTENGNKIVEMLGKEANDWNDMLDKLNEKTILHIICSDDSPFGDASFACHAFVWWRNIGCKAVIYT